MTTIIVFRAWNRVLKISVYEQVIACFEGMFLVITDESNLVKWMLVLSYLPN